jgi:hypothetical protein
MERHQFLGSTDLGIVTSLLTNYNVPTKLPDGIKLNKIKHQDDFILIELGTLLTSNECDEIVRNIKQENFENMSEKYDTRKRNSSRLVIMDDQLARTFWRRLKFSNKLTKLVQNTKPLGFNVQGQWVMSGVNPAMRLNKYDKGDYFSPHKDAQYAPSGDERSLLSLLVYLNDNYEKGETKFYFPKQLPKSNIKGLTIAEEIESYGGLENGFECIALKPKKGFAVLFTHNLLHEAASPEISGSVDRIERLVLRTDVLVKRKDKPLGFAVCPEEKEDYLACLNFFREAQQSELKMYENSRMFVKTIDIGELYERSLSIRYCYPRLLELQSIVNKDEEQSLIYQLPTEMWLRIFKLLHEQDVQHLIFAFPQFQLLKIVWEAQVTKDFVTDLSRAKFIPTIDTQYGSRTLFRFPDSNFFYQHVNGCCRVAAVYAFFLLGHGKDSTSYIVRYDRNTQEVCEVQIEQVLTDAFYNRNCYGSLYRVNQKDEKKRQPIVDFDHSVDRAYLTNRHQSQFIGQDLLSRFHCMIRSSDAADSERSSDEENDDEVNESHIQSYQRQHALNDRKNKLVDNEFGSYDMVASANDPKLSYSQHLMKQDSGASLFRMVSTKDHCIDRMCLCGISKSYKLEKVRDSIRFYNHLVFDFDRHQLTVERLPDEKPSCSFDSLLRDCVRTLQRSVPEENPISYYRVNIEQLAKETKGFNHASCQCSFPAVEVDQFSFLDYTHLSHVHLAVAQNSDHVFVLATYGGVVAL